MAPSVQRVIGFATRTYRYLTQSLPVLVSSDCFRDALQLVDHQFFVTTPKHAPDCRYALLDVFSDQVALVLAALAHEIPPLTGGSTGRRASSSPGRTGSSITTGSRSHGGTIPPLPGSGGQTGRGALTRMFVSYVGLVPVFV